MSVVRRFKPLFDRVLVSKAAAETTTAAGIILPEAATKAPNEATVVATGPGFRNADGETVPPVVKEGDKVLLPEFGGTKIELEGEEFFLFRDSDILGTLE
mmetsp:Transcript_8596/g.22194  ORF Transcript_8596/g.22194 Transcript_8596/m.22194 type:complete len:100 (-) Transcript_8596:83-382(-)|eukprot:CAMPEP_0182924562 /NCGR_PEP_ID=MMETSP0105_2-20130417/6633_1 /TAXON_ID=81532 ORGANISM="Acanthoeca-like sp., Strain 10tr" /NCGR_SAMPLE_ID=MMETSP0105_2 /ASSEMBLY_ACC=CAM_ASM_000205 /LENGTH=99 /DNA_ID=CAMNT_0025062355 /DNA_START=8 /DNA_END=307 /DNA_ORIENTATION=+